MVVPGGQAEPAVHPVPRPPGLFRGLDLPNCGCYGVFFPQPLRWYSPLEDLALVGLGYVLYVSAKKGRDNS